MRVVSATPAHTPTTHVANKGKGKGKSKGKGKGNSKAKGKGKAAAQVRLPSVLVKWTEPPEAPSWAFLVTGLYGEFKKADGWAIRPQEVDEATSDPMELSVEEMMHLHAIKAEMLCPKM